MLLKLIPAMDGKNVIDIIDFDLLTFDRSIVIGVKLWDINEDSSQIISQSYCIYYGEIF